MKITIIYNPDYIDSETDRIRFWSAGENRWIKKISIHPEWKGLNEYVIYTSDKHGVDRDGGAV